MRLLSKLSIGLAAVLVSASIATAQTAPQAPPVATPKAVQAPPVAAPKVTEPAKAGESAVKGVPKKATTPEGIECSAQADAKNLHGKERTKFRKKCISDIKKAAAAAKGAPAATAPPAAKKN